MGQDIVMGGDDAETAGPHDAAFVAAFEVLPGMFLLLTPSLKIVGASDEYLVATMTERERVVGRSVFDVFPDNPDDPDATGERLIRASFDRVLRDREAHTIPAAQFDIERPESEGGGFEERWWRTHNRPVLDDKGEVRLILNCVEDVTEARRLQGASNQLERDLEHKTDLTKLIIERAHNAFVSMDVAGRITEWNPSAERIFGWSKSDVLGLPVSEVVIPERYRDAHTRGLERFLASGEGPVLNRTIEIESVRRDGSEFPVALTISPIEIDGACTFHAFIQDISERKAADQERERHGEELARANEQLAAADRLKDQFLAMASHEMRTPLTAISGFTATMQTMWDQLGDEQKRDFVSIIDTQASRLQRLVDDLLTLARIESGAIQARRESVTVALELKKTVRELGAEHVTITCPANLRAMADPDQLQQILVNFIGNAIKYGDEPIELVARPISDTVEIRVTDQGNGVPEEFVPHLFERFARASTTRSEMKGTGLGLSITLGLAHAQGGDAWYEPNEPQGSCFVVQLPTSDGPIETVSRDRRTRGDRRRPGTRRLPGPA